MNFKSLNVPEIGPDLPKRGNFFINKLGRFAIRLIGWSYEGEFPNLKKFIAIGAPHTSFLDVYICICSLWVLGIKVSVMVKHTAFDKPYGPILRWAGAIPIDRRAANGIVGQMVEQFEQHDKFALAIAPEGTRKYAERWKSGFYRIARAADVPIVPIGIDFADKKVKFLPAFETTDDIEKDMLALHAQFDSFQGKHPERFKKSTE